MITDIECFPAFNNKFEFIEVDVNRPSMIKVRRHWVNNGENCSHLYLLDVRNVDIDILKRHAIWDRLNPEVQKEIENLTEAEKQAVHSLLEKARRGRKSKYPNVPRELVCSCGAKEKVAPGTLVKKIEKIALKKGILYTIDDYLKAYKCARCCPRIKGRQSTGKCAPTELVCKCGKTITYPLNVLRKIVDKKGIELEKFISGWACQKCKPSPRGRPKTKKGKK